MEMTSNNRKIKKQILWIIIGFPLFLFLFSFVIQFFYTKSNITCGTFYKKGTSRYIDYYHYYFYADGEKCTGSISEGDLELVSLDSLKKMECIEIEYSLYNTIYSRVVDTRIITDEYLREIEK